MMRTGVLEDKSRQTYWNQRCSVIYSERACQIKRKIPAAGMPLNAPLKPLISYITARKKTFFLLLTIGAGIYILWPLHNFQNYLAQGDHGRDLYCFKKAMEGAVPYRDFSWLFGPLMPYYYSIFYSLGGVSIQSVLLGQMLLVLLTGVFIYLTCSVFLSPSVAFACALWYWGFRGMEFFYTYNHIGGLLAMIASLYCLFRYIRDSKLGHAYAGFVCIFLLAMIRLNMGLAILAGYVLSLYITDLVMKDKAAAKKRLLFAGLSLAVAGMALLVHWLLLSPLPDYAISQSFPYAKSQRVDQSATPLSALRYGWDLIYSYFTATLAQIFFGALLLLSAAQTLFLLCAKKLPEAHRKNLILAFLSLFLFMVLSSHEFVASGVYYRIVWFFPLIYIAIFFLITTATWLIQSRAVQMLILTVLLFPSVLNIDREHFLIRLYKNPAHLLQIGNNRIYTTQDPWWFQTVYEATAFIKQNIPPSDTILVLPLDPLYLFLGERDSATRQLVFFEHFNIPPQQELDVIADMEKNRGNWAIISNRSVSQEGGMGTFGKDYCPILAKYLEDHFAQVAQFGDWTNPPGWAWNHGVKILKRVR